MTETADRERRLRASYIRHDALARTYRQRADESAAAYAENRIRSLVHHFLALVEHPDHDPLPFHELLAVGFSLQLVEPPIETYDALAAWVAGPLSSVAAMAHVVGDVALETLGDGEYSATIGMQSEALFPNGNGIASRTTQVWSVADDRSARFARVRKITIRRDEVRQL